MNNEAKFLTRNIGYLELVTMYILRLVTISQGPFESGVRKGGLSGLLCSRFSIHINLRDVVAHWFESDITHNNPAV